MTTHRAGRLSRERCGRGGDTRHHLHADAHRLPKASAPDRHSAVEMAFSLEWSKRNGSRTLLASLR